MEEVRMGDFNIDIYRYIYIYPSINLHIFSSYSVSTSAGFCSISVQYNITNKKEHIKHSHLIQYIIETYNNVNFSRILRGCSLLLWWHTNIYQYLLLEQVVTVKDYIVIKFLWWSIRNIPHPLKMFLTP